MTSNDPSKSTPLSKRNLATFRRVLPALADALANRRPAWPVVDAAGDVDAERNGQRLYGEGGRALVGQQLARFLASPNRGLAGAPDLEAYDSDVRRFHDRLLGDAAAAGIRFMPRPLERSAYFLIVFGVGMGMHLETLAAEMAPTVMVVLEPDLDLLRLSLDHCDWTRIADALEARGGRLIVLTESEPDALALSLREELRAANPCALDGFAYFVHTTSPLFQSVMKAMGDHKNFGALFFRHLGFLYDESIMLSNAYRNLSTGKATLYRQPADARSDWPVLLVGAGPSLDAEMETIKRLAERAVVISCGTALRPLLKNGVAPDFHAEIENINVEQPIAQAASEFGLSAVTLVAAATVQTTVPAFFGRAVLCFRPSVSPFPLFAGTLRHCLRHPEPAVINLALSFVQEMGFRAFYFFGVDLGVRKIGGEHHSRDAYHFTEGAYVEETDYAYELTVPANKGGTSMTSEFLFRTAEHLTRAMRAFATGRRYVNCSDGMLIDGAAPGVGAEVTLPEPACPKAHEIARLLGQLDLYDETAFQRAWNVERLETAAARLFDALDGILGVGADMTDRRHLARLMTVLQSRVTEAEIAADPPAHTVMAMVRGSIFSAVLIFEYYRNRAAGTEAQAAFQEIGKRAFADHLARMRAYLGHILAHPSELPPEPAPYAGPPVRIDLGAGISRLSACPCGSGQPYKRCHGASF